MSSTAHVKNLLDAAWRRKWWVILPTILGVAVSIYLLQRLPKIYRATTTVLVVSQRLPETYVKTTVTSGLQERLASLKVQILGPSYLDRVIENLGLLPPGASQAEMERVRDELASRIQVPDSGRTSSFFRISVNDENPKTAAKVANMLADMFIEQNGRLRTEQAAYTSSQMKVWVDERKRQLDALEEKVATYRRAYYGELPDQQGTNVQLITVAQGRLGQIADNIAQRQSRIEFLRTQSQTMKSINSAAGLPPADLHPDLRRLQQLEGELSALRLSYTDQNPDVRKKIAEIEEFKKLHPGLIETGPDGEESPMLSTNEREIQRLEREIAGYETERAGLNRQIDQLTARVRNTPLREQEISSITRDLDNLRSEYQDLLRKYDEARRAEDLESARQSEHFRVQDRAGVPGVPYSPNPPKMIGLGLAIGLGLGLGLAFLFEFFDQSLRSEEAFKAAFPELPLLVSIPNLHAASQMHRSGKGKGKKKHKPRKSAAALLLWLGPLVSTLIRNV